MTTPPEEVLRAYRLPPPWEVERVGGTRNVNFRVRHAEGSVFLRRRHPDYCDEGWVRFDHDALSHLSRLGAPVNVPLTARDGGTSIRCEGQLYEAHPWVEGNPFPGTEEAIRSVASSLARFHRAGASWGGAYDKGGYRRGEMDPTRLARNLADAQGISAEGDDLAAGYLAQVNMGGARLAHDLYDRLPRTLVHGDVQPANAIFAGARLSAFVDFDWMSRQPVIYDLAYGVILFCGRRERPIDGADIWSLTGPFVFDEAAARGFLRAYLEAGGELSDALRPALMEQIRLTWAHVRIDGARKVAAPDRPRFLGRDPAGPFEWIEERKNGDWF